MRRFLILFVSLASLFSILSAQYLAELPVTPLAFDARALKDAFNSASSKPRLIAVMSPT
jgi:hypothetical protein